MTRGVWPVGEIEVTVSGAFTTHHRFWTEAGTLGEMTLPALRRCGVFDVADGRELAVCRTSWWGRSHEMREGGVALCTARLQGFWRRAMDVRYRNREYVLQPAGFWTQSWHLVDALDHKLLEIRPRGVFRRGAFMTALAAIDADLLVFAYYLVWMRWQEQSAAASTSASTTAVVAAG